MLTHRQSVPGIGAQQRRASKQPAFVVPAQKIQLFFLAGDFGAGLPGCAGVGAVLAGLPALQ